MDSGKDMSEIKTKVDLPAEGLAANAEGQAAPTADTEQPEFYIEEEAAQSETAKTNMSQSQAYAAFKEEKRKRKAKAEQLEKSAQREKELADELSALREQVSGMAKGKPPTLEDCGYDDEVFQQKTREYFTSPAPAKKAKESNPEQPGFKLTDEQEFNLHQSEQKLKKSFNDYDEAKGNVAEMFSSAGLNGGLVMDELSAYAHTFGVDPGKAFYALSKNPSKVKDIMAAGGNPMQIGKALRDLESKIKLRESKKIESTPEPEVNSTGSVDVINEQINQARKAYQKDPSTDNFKKLQAAKKKVNSNG